MTSAFGHALPCPRCGRRLEPICWHDDDRGTCRSCETEFEFTAFPALTAARAPAPAHAALPATDSACYFHAENRAEVVCDSCGRFLCPVCAIRQGDRTFCPACISSAGQRETIDGIRRRNCYDTMALAIAVLPLIVFPFTLVGAPAALGTAAWAWRKPGSLVRGRHLRFTLAVLVAAIEIGCWSAFIMYPRARAVRPLTVPAHFGPNSPIVAPPVRRAPPP